jgi:hypothetical protein
MTNDRKYQQALALTDGDTILSRAVLNISRNKKNAWNDFIAGPAPQEVKDEWSAISTCGFGNQKKLIRCRLFIRFSLFCNPPWSPTRGRSVLVFGYV